MQEPLRFTLLGAVTATRGSQEIMLGPPQQRGLLARLLLAEGTPLSATVLIDALWGDSAPDTAVNTVRIYAHRLRKALEPDVGLEASVIQSQGDGYRLRISPHQTDLGVFTGLTAEAERARRSGDIAGAVKLLHQGLDLWHGAPLTGIRAAFADLHRARLERLRLETLTACLAAELDLGTSRQTLAELTALVTENPLHEELRALLMLGLYRSSQQATALSTYQEGQRLLADELGVDPGPHLQSLYTRMLRADPALMAESTATPAPGPGRHSDASRTSPNQLPRFVTAFIGRRTQSELAVGVVEETQAAAVVIAAVTGTAGVGKTTFAVHLAHRVADHYPDGQLYVNLRGFDPSGEPLDTGRALRVLLESLGAEPSQLPHDTDALAARYRSLLAGRRMLLLLDNARDAGQVVPLLPGTPGCLVIVTSRNQLMPLITQHEALSLPLGTLTTQEADEFLRRRLGTARVDAEPQAARRIAEHCAHLPLALAITAARAAAHPAFPLAAIAGELTDSQETFDALSTDQSDTVTNIRAVFSWSYRTLSEEAGRLFRLLAHHLGPDISLRATASLIARTVGHTRRLLNELVQAHLLDEHLPGRYLFHDLLRAYATELAADDPPAVRDDSRRRALDHYLHSARHATEALDPHLGRIAHQAPGEGVGPEAFPDRAAATAWYAAEHQVLLRCIEQATAHHYDDHAWRLAVTTFHYLDRHGQWPDVRTSHEHALASARRLGDSMAEAFVLKGLTKAHGFLGDLDGARRYAELTLERFSAHPDMSRYSESHRYLTWVGEAHHPLVWVGESHRHLAWVAYQQGDAAVAFEHTRKAYELHSLGDNASLVAKTLNSLAYCRIALSEYDEAVTHCHEALKLMREAKDMCGEADVLDTLGNALQHRGDHAQAAAAYEQSVVLARQYGNAVWDVADTLRRMGEARLSLDDRAAARAAWSQALALIESLVFPGAERMRRRLEDLMSESE
ncbi:AfsR/SARP family transcriptional regulator [Streptomyces capillispiralis]|uniref:DNA-binding SARP family transcriptional activator n=1 Tax=Streptomyces capillispiralis TaxID=68182 RepID=A0A561SGX3_9ACTN|nr:BTAD domain-containing putative transcriptional regulator [Streptomyces capillispiralis]TWF74114.1 DNA-binding SARP family transcriptional activator [Streptomyces capillispiralis]GHE23975.1 SARP family transcriptional regulator [Streptomyces capillispiralis]